MLKYINMETSFKLIKGINENFYDSIGSKKELSNFSRALIQSICKEYGVSLPRLVYEYMNPFEFGEYKFKSGLIKINKYLYQNFDHFKEEGNKFYIFKMIESVLHETRHHLQFQEITDLHSIVKNTAIIAKLKKGAKLIYGGNNYNTVPLEIDARHYSFVRLNENEYLKKYTDSQVYIDNEIDISDEPYEYKPLLKNKSQIFKPALANIKVALSTIKTNSEIGRDKTIYYSIAPKFNRNCNSPLSLQENNVIEEEHEKFISSLFYTAVKEKERKYNKQKKYLSFIDKEKEI